MVNVDLNGLEIGSVLLIERNHEIQVGIESCAAVTVFALFRWFVMKSCETCVDLSARKVKDKLRCVSFWYANPRMEETCKVVVAVSESDTSHDVFFSCHGEGTQACAYHEGCGTKLELESSGVFELLVEIVLHNARMTAKNGNSGLNSSLSELEQIEDMTITIAKSTKCLKCARPCVLWKALLRSLVVDGNLGSRDVVCPIPRVGLLEERPAVSGTEEKTQDVKWRTTQLKDWL